MRTKDRKNAKRFKKLLSLKGQDPKLYLAEKTRLLMAWREEVFLRVNNIGWPSAFEIVETAEKFGMGEELTQVVIKAVEKAGGPVFRQSCIARIRKND